MNHQRVHDWWQRTLGTPGWWPAQELYEGLAQQFIAEVRFEDRAAFDAVRGRSCLYVANHQVAVESILFNLFMSAYGEVTTCAIAKAEHRNTWVGRVVGHSFTYPGVTDPGLMAFFERDPVSIARAFDDLAITMKAGQRSVLVHVDGTRALDCRTPTARLSPALLDMALAAQAPVVPVRFTGGLPVESTTRLEFPLGYGQQDYWIGRPILPEELQRVAYRERKDVVLAAINTLGVTPVEEMPAAPDDGFAGQVDDWMQQTGAAQEYAAIFVALRNLAQPGAAIGALLNGAQQGVLEVGSDPAGQWLGQLAAWLYGPHGPRVQGLNVDAIAKAA